MKLKIKFAIALVFLLSLVAICEGVILDGAIRGKNGLSYSAISYGFDSISVTIRNSTKYNVNFGGTMLFLDKNYKVLARAELLTAKIKRRSSRKYKAFFSEGTGNDAKRARYLEWEF
ncbi:MAG: hypothetical protein IJS40_02160 [Synergistaceae bacterium]|nr:hypothetical protein [Synergistaceae bacterium]